MLSAEEITESPHPEVPDPLGNPELWTRLAEAFELSLLDQMLLRDLVQYAGHSRDRALAVILAALLRTTRDGHLCLDLAAKAVLSQGAGQGEFADLRPWVQQFMAGVDQERYGELVARSNANLYRPLVWVQRPQGPLLYFHKYHFHARRLQHRLREYLAVALPPTGQDGSPDDLPASLYRPEEVLRVGSDLHPIARDAGQIRALEVALGSQLALISGGPGTGKTSLMVNLLRALARMGVQPASIILGAPTGRAAQRMTEAVGTLLDSIRQPAPQDRSLKGLTAQTLHTILRYRPRTNEFHFNRRRPLSAQLVVLDETSMVDVVLMDQFLQALDPKETRLVMLGDKDQLPAVEAGAVFTEMMPARGQGGVFAAHLATLETVFRSGTRLACLAQEVNAGSWPADPPQTFDEALAVQHDDWSWVPADSVEHWGRCLTRWTRRWYQEHWAPGSAAYGDLLARAGGCTSADLLNTPPGIELLERLFAVLEGVRILTLVRKGPYGCEEINANMVGHLARITERAPADSSSGLFAGVPVLITRNDHSRQLYNGDVGLCLEDRDGLRQVYFRRGRDFTAWPADMLPPFEGAFAMTVHKSQGSEYGRVLLVLPDDPAQRLLSREILYTGITRARQQVLVYGPRDVLDAALARRIKRISGLQWG